MEIWLAFGTGVTLGYAVAVSVVEARRQKFVREALSKAKQNDKRPSTNRRSNKKK